MKQNFFSDLPAFRDFQELTLEKHYWLAPEDWTVVITDVEGSTKAIEAGKYKTVNMVGAATVTAVMNAVGSRDIPFVFGGDGTSALVPNESLPRVRAALGKSREISFLEHGLKLRIGLVPHADLIAAGAQVRVAKFELAPGNSIAFFRGTGLGRAEEWVKGGKYLLPLEEHVLDFDPHEGLSCRWAPLKNSRGAFLSVLIKIREEAPQGFAAKLLKELDQILQFGSPSSHPVKHQRMRTENIFRGASLENSFRVKEQSFLKTLGFMIFVKALDQGWMKLKNFSMKEYKKSLAANSDYRKFDETLRMVIDATPEMKNELELLLAGHHAKGELVYGIHESPTALMTCFVQSYSENKHLHFIDGGNGGYAMAARNMKAQMAEKKRSSGSLS